MGKKTNIPFYVPGWVGLSSDYEDEFFGSYVGSEAGIPKIHKQGNRLDMLMVGLTGREDLIENKVQFLLKLKDFLESKEIRSTSIHKNVGKTPGTILCRLLISISLENVLAFERNIKINYCSYKKQKLSKSIGQFKAIKKQKYQQLIQEGYGAEQAMKLLRIQPPTLYALLQEEAAI